MSLYSPPACSTQLFPLSPEDQGLYVDNTHWVTFSFSTGSVKSVFKSISRIVRIHLVMTLAYFKASMHTSLIVKLSPPSIRLTWNSIQNILIQLSSIIFDNSEAKIANKLLQTHSWAAHFISFILILISSHPGYGPPLLILAICWT